MTSQCQLHLINSNDQCYFQLGSFLHFSFSFSCSILIRFYCASICEGGLGSRNSVRLSVTCVDWCSADILTPHEWAITLLLLTPTVLAGQGSLPSKICTQSDPPLRKTPTSAAHNISTVGDSKTSSIMTNIKSTTGFPTSHRWSAYVTPKSRKGGLRSDFFRFLGIKVNFNWQKSATKILYVKTFSGKVVVQPLSYLMVHRH